MKEKYLGKEKAKKYNVISKIVYVLAMIGKVLSIVIASFIGLMAVIVILTGKSFSYENGKIGFLGETFELSITEDGIDLMNDGKVVSKIADNFDSNTYNFIKENIQTLNVKNIFIGIELAFVGALAIMILITIMFHYLHKLFKNFNKEESPFTKVNALIIKKEAILLIWIFAVSLVSNIVIQLLLTSNIAFSFNLMTILFILALFVLYYIFEYGVSLENKEEKVN